MVPWRTKLSWAPEGCDHQVERHMEGSRQRSRQFSPPCRWSRATWRRLGDRVTTQRRGQGKGWGPARGWPRPREGAPPGRCFPDVPT